MLDSLLEMLFAIVQYFLLFVVLPVAMILLIVMMVFGTVVFAQTIMPMLL